MLRGVLCFALSMVALLPNRGNAQVYQVRTPSPPVTAQGAEWQTNGQPVLVNGLVYYPTAETRFFDGQIMAQVGVYQSVPVYADVTLEPNSVIYVPVGRYLVRGYERRRSGDLAGTEGSRVSAFPVDIPSSIGSTEQRLPTPVGTAGTVASTGARTSDLVAPTPAPTHIVSIPPPSGINGIWVLFEGARWYSRGASVSLRPERFTQVGDYRGFPVYREKNGRDDEIWIATVKDGPLAPYARR